MIINAASFLPPGTRYYNCVPFAGCVFVAPSNLYQPRVKTFEELPLEVPPHKAPQVSAVPGDRGDVVTLRRFNRRRVDSPAGQPDGQRDGAGLRGAEEDRAPAEGRRLQEVGPSEKNKYRTWCIGAVLMS